MRIAIYIVPKSFAKPTGQTKHAINMALCLSRQPGVEVVLLAARDQLTADGKIPVASPLNHLPIRRIPLPAKLLHFLWRTFNGPALDRWSGKVDWVYSPTEMFVPAKKARTAVTIHCVNWFENDLPWSNTAKNLQLRSRMAKVFKPIIKRADLVCTVSEFLKGRIIELLGGNPARLVVVGNGVEAEFLAEGKSPEINAEPYVLSVGSLESRKGAEHLIRLARHLAQSHPRLKLVIGAGQYGDARFINEAKQLPNVVLTGYLDLKELPPLLKKAKALVILSRYETFGIPVIEAMAAGTPVIAARFAALPEIVGPAGMLVDATRPGEIADAINRLDATGIRENYRQLGFQRIQQFTWEACAARLSASLKPNEQHQN